MLFRIKMHAGAALACAAVFLLVWRIGADSVAPAAVFTFDVGAFALGAAAILFSDAVLHGLFGATFGEAYLARYRLMAGRFQGQSPAAVLCGGVLAAAEELIFRGVLLAGLVSLGGLSTPVAVVIAAVAFGAAHALPDRRLALFTAWSIWEGALLGIVFVQSESLAVVAAVHALHDVLGFTVFAVQRRTGWMLGKREESPA